VFQTLSSMPCRPWSQVVEAHPIRVTHIAGWGVGTAGCKAGGMALRFETKKPGVQWAGVALDIVGAATFASTKVAAPALNVP
jgi:hypothetical protein